MMSGRAARAWSTDFIARLADIKGPNIFNPYRHRCPEFDRPDAVETRSANLRSLLAAAAEQGIEAIWFGQELGHRGGRRTGIALSDETRLDAWGELFCVELRRATIGPAVSELTAGHVARVLASMSGRRVLGWNAFPLHAHHPGKPFSNRGHTRQEAAATAPFAQELISRLEPRNLIALGQKAAATLQVLDPGLPITMVRHPSFGGAGAFVAQITAAMRS